MQAEFTLLDWAVVAGYILLLALAGWLSTRRQRDAEDYFLAGHRVPIWLIAVSVLSTTQSAATFLGAPDYSYRGDYTYLMSYLGPLLAAGIYPATNLALGVPPFTPSQPFQLGDPLGGALGLLVDPAHGLLAFAALLVAGAALGVVLRAGRDGVAWRSAPAPRCFPALQSGKQPSNAMCCVSGPPWS